MTRSPFVVTEHVRWGDVDHAGVIFYGAYVRFHDLAETEIFRAAGLPYGAMFERFGIWLPRRVVHTEFHAPSRLDDHLKLVTYFSHVGRSSLTINFDVMGAGDGALRAATHQVLVCVDRATFATRPLPSELVRVLEPWTMSVAEARRAA